MPRTNWLLPSPPPAVQWSRLALSLVLLLVSLGLGLSIPATTASAQAPAQPPFYTNKLELLNWLDSQGQRQTIATVADWERRRTHILQGMQLVMGPLPSSDQKCDLEVQVLESEDLPGLVRQKIIYMAGPGDRIPAYRLIPKNITGRAPALICLHGTGGGRGRTAGVGEAYPSYTLELAQRGYVTIAPDYTLLGDNQTDPAALGYASGTMKGIWSHMRAVDLLAAMPEVDPDRIGTIGLSLGGHNSLFVGAFDPRLKVIVTSSGFDSFIDYMDGDPTGWCQTRYMPRIETVYGKDPHKLPFDFPEVLAALAPRAVYIHAPQSDSNFKLESVKRCVAAAQKVYELFGKGSQLQATYPPGEHGFPPEERAKAYAFIDQALSHQPQSEPL
jgi:dienelactone hydrolase